MRSPFFFVQSYCFVSFVSISQNRKRPESWGGNLFQEIILDNSRQLGDMSYGVSHLEHAVTSALEMFILTEIW